MLPFIKSSPLKMLPYHRGYLTEYFLIGYQTSPLNGKSPLGLPVQIMRGSSGLIHLGGQQTPQGRHLTSFFRRTPVCGNESQACYPLLPLLSPLSQITGIN